MVAPAFTESIPVCTVDSRANVFSSITILELQKGTTLPGPERLFLQQTIVVELETTTDGYVVRSGYLDEDAYGQTLEAAHSDFLASLRDRYQSLLRHEATLSPPDRDVLTRLRALIDPAPAVH